MSEDFLQQAVSVLRDGGIIAYPTEAVFGLGCDPQQTEAIQRLLAIKDRPYEKGLILIAANEQQLHPYLAMESISEEIWQRVRASWPGPVTWLLPVKPEVSEMLRGKHASLAVRVSAHPLVQQLCLAFGGAIVSTSANRSGEPPARSAEQVNAQLGRQIDFVLPGETAGADRPSEIRDGMTNEVIRPGS